MADRWLCLRLRKQLRHRLGLHQLSWLVEVVVNNRLGVDAEAVVHRREQLGGMHGGLGGGAAGLVGLAMHVVALDAAPAMN